MFHLLPLLLALASTPAADRTAREIVEDSRRAYRVENAIQTVRMSLVSKSGNTRARELEIRVRRDGDLLKSYSRFQSPSDVAGTQLVLVDHPNQEDEQLLYMPALQRVTRISGNARSGAFVGSDFRYSDFEVDDGPDAVHTLKEETADEWLVETVPGGGSDWSRFETRISKTDNVPRQIGYYDKKGVKVREMTVEKVETKDGVPVAMVSVMKDLKRGTSTRMEVLKIQVNVPTTSLPDDVFTGAYMERNG